MTQAEIDAGHLRVLVGIAPTKSAEFIVFRLGHKNRHLTHRP
jgi:phage tail sheath protein FI